MYIFPSAKYSLALGLVEVVAQVNSSAVVDGDPFSVVSLHGDSSVMVLLFFLFCFDKLIDY